MAALEKGYHVLLENLCHQMNRNVGIWLISPWKRSYSYGMPRIALCTFLRKLKEIIDEGRIDE